ncbi:MULTISPECIES: BID domain-containing T4SS effector [unclassified Bartonella]|uniref:BID domain-containing T4SS effector n=1 Tax=unclassified Bartonella TaxID=2645622 RepID=UPI00099A9131|nr:MULTISPECIES: BID domain-containing T4SS effector [unclassified Bartonella]AQX27535.1 Bartonella effector protein Bep5/2 [Bartonella sp. JB15]AQX28815.1 Bartonella effector protein Bep5/2 [Bartonella sp. JB63]
MYKQEQSQKFREAFNVAVNLYMLDGLFVSYETFEIIEKCARRGYSLEQFNILMDNTRLSILKDSARIKNTNTSLEEKIKHNNLQTAYDYTSFNRRTMKNKYGLEGKAFERICAHDIIQAIVNLKEEPLPEKFDSSYLKYLHKCLYGKAFEWAGCIRQHQFQFSDSTVTKLLINNEIKKELLPEKFASSYLKGLHKYLYGKAFEWAVYIRQHLFQFSDGTVTETQNDNEIERLFKKIDQILAEKDNLRGLSREKFVDEASKIFAFLNNIYPFQFGSECTLRIFFEKMAEAGGYNLDFSVVTKQRMWFVCHAALPSDGSDVGDIIPMRHLFEDISNPEKVCVLKEFIAHMRDVDMIKYTEMKNKVFILPTEGSTYTGIYKDCSPDSIRLMVKDNYFICKKDYFAPETLKTLLPGQKLIFTASIPNNFQNILLPGEKLASLTEKEIATKIVKNASVQTSREKIRHLSKHVYRDSNILNKDINLINMDSGLSEQHVKQIVNFSKYTSQLSGTKVFNIRTPSRKRAEANYPKLVREVNNYISIVIATRKKILQKHQREQERCQQVVEIPNQVVQDILNLPKEEQIKALNANPQLNKDIEDFLNKVKTRLSTKEYQALDENHYEKLASSIGISMNRAREIAKIVQKAQVARHLSREYKICKSRTMAIAR